MPRKLPRVVHMTSVHDPRDPRIFGKQCRSLARAGFQVTLIAATSRNERIDGVQVVGVGPAGSRWKRMTRTASLVYRKARSIDADIYHFHDPELIPWGLLLARSGKPVVYDVHEDYATGLRQKDYLAAPLGAAAAFGMGKLEGFAARRFACVIAESYYAERFPDAIEVLNFPVVDSTVVSAPGCDPASNRLLYTGGVTIDRGAHNHARLAAGRQDLEIHFVGRCTPALANEMRRIAGSAADRIQIEGEGHYVDPDRVRMMYRDGQWLAGLALFPETAHYRRKALTKFFEYMMAGLPVLCSDFPAWRALIDHLGCGIAVNPDAPDEAIGAIDYLQKNPEVARSMGERGRQAVLRRYNWGSEDQKLQSLYRRLLA